MRSSLIVFKLFRLLILLLWLAQPRGRYNASTMYLHLFKYQLSVPLARLHHKSVMCTPHESIQHRCLRHTFIVPKLPQPLRLYRVLRC